MLCWVDESEAHAVGGQSNNELFLRHSYVQPVVDGPVLHNEHSGIFSYGYIDGDVVVCLLL